MDERPDTRPLDTGEIPEPSTTPVRSTAHQPQFEASWTPVPAWVSDDPPDIAAPPEAPPEPQGSAPADEPGASSEFDLPHVPVWTTYRSPGVEPGAHDSDAPADLPRNPIDLDFDIDLLPPADEPFATATPTHEARPPESPPAPEGMTEQPASTPPGNNDTSEPLESFPSLETLESHAGAQAQETELAASTPETQDTPALPDLSAALEAVPVAAPHFTSEPLAHAPAAAVRRGIARLIEYRRDRYVAFAPHTTIELVENPSVIEVPGAASYGLGLMSWQNGWLPVIDLAWLLHGRPSSEQHAPAPRYALVLAYQAAPRQPVAHGAIALELLPQFAAVSDTQLCPWPDAHPCWPQLGLSCFAHEGQAVPILDTSRLFTSYHPPWATPP